ncbi:MAG: YihY/virulence factor BrkB family protein [Rhizomicrobium sp.]
MVGEGIDAFIEDEALTRGAAIAFYAVTSIAPLLFVAVTIASIGFGQDAARHAIFSQFHHMMSRESADLLQLAVRNVNSTSNGVIGSIVGVATLILTTSGVFGEMEDALNIIWRAPRKGSVLRRLLRGRAVSLALVIGLGFLLLVSMTLTALLAALSHYIDVHTPYSQFALMATNVAIGVVLMTLLFAAIYKVLPNLDLEWRDVLPGAFGTTVLVQVGQLLLGWYFGSTSVAAPYGAAGGLIILLLWVYYLAQVFLLGAEFTKVYACHFGSHQTAACRTPEPAPEFALPGT